MYMHGLGRAPRRQDVSPRHSLINLLHSQTDPSAPRRRRRKRRQPCFSSSQRHAHRSLPNTGFLSSVRTQTTARCFNTIGTCSTRPEALYCLSLTSSALLHLRRHATPTLFFFFPYFPTPLPHTAASFLPPLLSHLLQPSTGLIFATKSNPPRILIWVRTFHPVLLSLIFFFHLPRAPRVSVRSLKAKE